MSNHGGRADEPTSYDLQPPRSRPAQPPPPPARSVGDVQLGAPRVDQEPTRSGGGAAAGWPVAGQGAAPAMAGSVPAPGLAAGSGTSSAPGSADEPVPGGSAFPDAPRNPPGTADDGDTPDTSDAVARTPTTVTAAVVSPATPPASDPVSADRPPAATDSEGAGRLVGGRYRLVSRLGHGGMGTVWKAHDEVVKRDVAVKEPRIPDTLPESQRQTLYQRMQREAHAAARIDHPSVVTVHDVAVEDGRPWIVMELVRGRSLATELAEGTLEPREAARIGVAVLGALAAAHEVGVLHRDVKPDNVLLGRNDRVVLTDFGIAQVEGEQGLTETGAFVGSPEFIAPERVLGQRPGPESDLWSLGVVLYAAVEGMSPFRRTNTPATLQAVLSAEPQMPARGAGALGALIMQLLRKEPTARPTVAEVLTELETLSRPPAPAPMVLADRGGAGGGRAVSRVLRTNRKAQYGVGGGVLVVVLAVLLWVIDPFGGGTALPSNWVVREEGEVVKASLAVPRDYQREVDSEDGYVVFDDPSGVFTVYLGRTEPEKDTDGVRQEAKEWVEHYKSGGLDGTEMKNVKSSWHDATQQGKPAANIDTTYREYGGNEDDIRYHQKDRLYVNDKKAYWLLSVTMPAAGDAREDGEKLFRDVARHLKIRDGEL